ncbi:tocopherol cyclase family protein [Lachnoclostridium phytofermentans]|uniref:Tocopherol cyclase n=1 Tax=Lachnoclostridium phytofermentans (strain ATCC 700394 / DSM 18823 / ISDg) TaxID=357809 RepID=A9KMS4_LACP7|nr:tocopherol cyclase family protein [Lachnoclostridium phytofermentans]ABX41519.1 conserved hypothetical protein [Lachnoclostridium phytofermentans ISDg]
MKYFYGDNKKASYFEGWYIKQQNEEETIAIIPSFHIDEYGAKSANLQIITKEGAYSCSFSCSEFFASKRRFFVKLGKSIFTESGMRINLHTENLTVTGRLFFTKKIPSKMKPDIVLGDFVNSNEPAFHPLRYSIMGYYDYVPFLPCKHEVVSMLHGVYGTIVINGKRIDFRDGLGYIEKDRGHSFPTSYLWTQCSFKKPSIGSIMASVAELPLLSTTFVGCICAIWYHGKEYRLATYLGGKIVSYSEKGFSIFQGKYLLEVSVIKQEPHSLKAPVKGAMRRRIKESVACKVRYRFYEDGKLLFEVVSNQAGYEHVIRKG